MTQSFVREGFGSARCGRRPRRLGRATRLALVAAAWLALAGLGSGVSAEAGAMRGKVNVNTASVEELQRLPGVGASRAEALVEARQRRGGFKSIDELVEVKGIGAASLEKLRPYVTLTGKTTASTE